MSMLGNLAFAAMDTFLKTEILKELDKWLNTEVINRLIEKIPDSGRPAPIPLCGQIRADFSGIEIDYTGTAMRKTENRVLHMEDMQRVIDINRVIPARPGATTEVNAEALNNPPSAAIRMQAEVVLSEPGISGGTGGMKAVIRKISFKISVEGSVNKNI